MPLSLVNESSNSDKHVASVSSILVHENRVYSGSDDGKIKMWSPELKLLLEKDTQCGGVLSMACSPNSLYTCGSDQTIQTWDLNTLENTGQVQSTLLSPLKLFCLSSTLWAGDSTGSVAKYDGLKEIAKHELVEEVWDIIVTSDPLLVYTARDRDVVIFEIQPDKRTPSVKSTLEGRYPVLLCGDKFCCLDRSGRNIIVHQNSLSDKFKKLNEFPASELILNAICAGSGVDVYSGGYDGKVSSWNIEDGTAKGHFDLGICVNALFSAFNKVYVGLADGRVVSIGN